MDRDELIRQNLGLVHTCAHRFRNKGIEYDDLYSAGCVGLIKAVDRYDPSLGYKLSTYAVPVILGEIKQLFRSGGSVKMSRSLRELSRVAHAAADEYRRDTGEEIPINILAQRLGVDAYQAAEALNASRAVLSLSEEQDEDGRRIEIPVPSHEEALTDRLSLRQVLDVLPPDDRELIRLRYYQHKTQQETARHMGTTQVQISRREKRILQKLRTMLI